MNRTLLTRRTVLQTAVTTALTAPFVHGAYAAGKLSFGVWDHWVPGAAEELKKICAEWAAKEKVDLNVDLITSNGDKDLLTLMAEGQAKAGHDMMGLRTWYVSAQADNFVPVDDIVLPVIKEYGPIAQASEYTGKIDGHWMAVPTSYGNGSLPPCARIDYMKEYVGLDVQKMYPAGAPPDKELVETWEWNNFLKAAEKCFKAGHPFGLGLSTCTDAINMAGAVFHSLWRRSRRRQRQYHGQDRRDPAGARILQAARPIPRRRRLRLRQRVEQQGAGFRQERADFQPAQRLCGGEARPAEGRRAIVDLPLAKGAAGPVRPVQPVFLGDLEFLTEHPGGEKPAGLSDDPPGAGKAGHRQRRLRHPALRQVDGFQDLGRRRSAEGHQLQLSAASRCDSEPRGLSGPPEDRDPDVCPGDFDED